MPRYFILTALIAYSLNPLFASETQAQLNHRLCTALEKGHAQRATTLMDQISDFDALNQDDKTPLMVAVNKVTSLNKKPSSNRNKPACDKLVTCIEELLDRGADPLAQNAHGQTALHFVTYDTPHYIRDLLARDPMVLFHDLESKTPAHRLSHTYAKEDIEKFFTDIAEGNLDAATEALESGKVNANVIIIEDTWKKVTPLRRALASNAPLSFIQLLIKHKANVRYSTYTNKSQDISFVHPIPACRNSYNHFTDYSEVPEPTIFRSITHDTPAQVIDTLLESYRPSSKVLPLLLPYAIKTQHQYFVKNLVDRGVDLNNPIYDGTSTAIADALQRNAPLTFIKFLVAQGAQVAQPTDRASNTALNNIDQQTPPEVVNFLCSQKIPTHLKNALQEKHLDYTRTFLFDALAHGPSLASDKKIKRILPNVRKLKELLLIEYLVCAQRNTPCPIRSKAIDLLIQEGANVNYTDSDGDTPLMLAVKNNCIQDVKTLLEAGADPKTKDRFSRDTVTYATRYATHPDIKEMLKNEVVISEKRIPLKKNETTLMRALRLNYPVKDLNFLIEKSAKANISNDQWRAALNCTSEQTPSEIIDLLMRQLPKIHQYILPQESLIPLRKHNTEHFLEALDAGDHDQVAESLDYGINKEAINERKALIIALRNNFPHSVVQSLVEAGAQVNDYDKKRHTALDYCTDATPQKTIDLLIKHSNAFPARLQKHYEHALAKGHTRVAHTLAKRGLAKTS